jgi:MFS family permease
MTSESAVISTHHHLPRLGRWAGYIALCVGMFMAILDIQVVVTSLKTIEEALGIGADRMSWVQTSYLIAEVIAIPIIGLLMRVFGMRRLFVGALGLFTFASIGCALSVGFWDLMAWRVVQGFAGGVLIPLVFSAIFLLFPRGLEQTLATTAGGFLAVLAPTMGPVTGGWLTEHFSWHWLFLINVLPGLVAVATGFFALPTGPLHGRLLRSLDWLITCGLWRGAGISHHRAEGSAVARLAVACGAGAVRALASFRSPCRCGGRNRPSCSISCRTGRWPSVARSVSCSASSSFRQSISFPSSLPSCRA